MFSKARTASERFFEREDEGLGVGAGCLFFYCQDSKSFKSCLTFPGRPDSFAFQL